MTTPTTSAETTAAAEAAAASEAGFYPAAQDALKGRFPRVYRRLGVPASPTYPYLVLAVTPGRGDTYTLDGSPGVRWGLVTVQAFGRSDEGAQAAASAATAALLGHRLDVPGWETTPCRLALDPTPTEDPDDAGVAGLTLAITFTATPLLTPQEA